MQILTRLFLYGIDHIFVPVTYVTHANTCNEIDIFIPIFIPYFATRRFFHMYGNRGV